ncbi:MraY family glycosyltransferase [Pallidibacillus pasinlerensis]|uniref:Undecaprenyl/decaprenyl-phosphate alpha-N-acetylglucosaminyl 1-phosphate transferase n=1 Tax=Pallidibacillus pasinlerensis TaxID=2703818 RepID=A0ABX0A5A2_9BACI|nr:MraY family glycosyltransferase [Pallidibacillus pasinlerensis]NCU17691.1 undecaprenyl/decaprenyl-phosphate alpha-N-acetylglucosaminyl 1-phosphate transferase [Pallidibacillus pasinlerensis]
MFPITNLFVGFAIACISAYLLVYPIKWLAFRFNVIDIPNKRKVHTTPTPRLGGLAIIFSTFFALFYLQPVHPQFLAYIFGAIIIIITGVLDDKFTLRPLFKLVGQILPAIFLIIQGVSIERITLPFIGIVEFSPSICIIVTLIWIIGITNAINLIDGLDGLASGVSTIALLSILIMAIMDGQLFIVILCTVLIGSNIGFLFHNFHPAKIYMGDTGSLFLGYSIAYISILGLFKKLTLFGFVIPVIVLGVPIFDTLFAIVRRLLNGEKIMTPDKKHIHHQLLAAGFSHRTTVLIIYGISAVFGLLAIIFSNASINYLLIITLIWALLVYILAEFVGLTGAGKKPILGMFKRILKINRQSQ